MQYGTTVLESAVVISVHGFTFILLFQMDFLPVPITALHASPVASLAVPRPPAQPASPTMPILLQPTASYVLHFIISVV